MPNLISGLGDALKNAVDPPNAGGTNPKKRGSAAKSAASAAKKKKGKSSPSSSSSSSSSSGSGPSTATRLSWETGTGIPFMGQMSAQVVHDVIFKFILGDADLNNNTSKIDLMYHYRIGSQLFGLRKLMDMDIPDDAGEWITNTNNEFNIFNPDECMNADPTEFLQYNGSLADFVRDLSNQPFNEVYWTHEEEDDHWSTVGPAQRHAIKFDSADPYDPNPHAEKDEQDVNYWIPHATLHYRQTPFEPNAWIQLPKLYLTSSDIINFQLDCTDNDQKSVFNITNSGASLTDIANLPPVTDDKQELQRKYGYRYMDVTSEYFLNTKSNVNMSPQNLVQAISRQDQDTQPGLAGLTYPSCNTFNDYFGPDAASKISNDPALELQLQLPQENGGNALYDYVLQRLQTHMDEWLQDQFQAQIQLLQVKADFATNQNPNPLQVASAQQQIKEKLQNEYSGTSSNFLNSLDWQNDKDIQAIINLPENLYQDFNSKTGQFEVVNNRDHIITLQKAGQLMMHYMLTMQAESKSIGKFLSSNLEQVLNPNLKVLDTLAGLGAGNNSSPSSKSKGKSKKKKK